MPWTKTKISEFLKERTERLKPDVANELNLPRIEKIDFSGVIYINSNKQTKTGMIIVKKGDLIISGINVEKGALAIYTGASDVLATIHYSAYIYDSTKINIEYLKWYLQSNIFKKIIKEQVKGGIKTEIKAKTFLNLEIMLPDLLSQNEIAKKINELSNYFNNLHLICTNNNELIKNLRQSILQEAIKGKLVPQDPNDEPASELLKRIRTEKEQLIKDGKLKKEKPLSPISQDEIPFKIPSNWEWCRFNEIIKIIEYGTSEKAQEKAIGIPVLRMNNIQNGQIEYSNLKFVSSKIKDLPRLYLKHFDLLFNRTNSYELVGKTALFLKEELSYTFASYLIRISLFNNHINPYYINSYLNSNMFKTTQIEPFIIQQCGQANYSGSKLKNTIIPIPPLEEQKRIVAKVDELMILCDKLEKENKEALQSSSELLQSIMQKYFTPEE